jgi:hypothetical protein
MTYYTDFTRIRKKKKNESGKSLPELTAKTDGITRQRMIGCISVRDCFGIQCKCGRDGALMQSERFKLDAKKGKIEKPFFARSLTQQSFKN